MADRFESPAMEPGQGKDAQEPLKCGVAGVGYLGQHHARIYSNLPGCRLVGVCDARAERANEIADRHRCEVFDTIEELGAACDAVSVVVPTDQHAEVAGRLLAQGCHLLIEKPLCTSLEEAERILAAAREAGTVIQVGHIEHYNPVMTFLEEAVDHPLFLTADRLAPFNPRGTEVGVVLDLMIHDLGVILALVKSPVKQVQSVGVRVLSRQEDIGNARIEFENGCVANLNTSRVSEKKVREIRVFQPAGYLSLNFMEQTGHLMRLENGRLERQEIPIEPAEPLQVELEAFTGCVRSRGNPKVDAELGKRALELAIRISAQIAERANTVEQAAALSRQARQGDLRF